VPLSDLEVKRIKAACLTDRERAIVGVLSESGMRLAEFANLVPEDVNWEESRISVLGKGNKRRIVPLSHEGAWMLAGWFNLGKRRGKKRTIQGDLRALGERAGLNRPLFPHLFRHGYAIRCLKRGINIVTLSRLLGHASIMTTNSYVNLAPEDVLSEFHSKWN